MTNESCQMYKYFKLNITILNELVASTKLVDKPTLKKAKIRQL